jgi:hypothetical protein
MAWGLVCQLKRVYDQKGEMANESVILIQNLAPKFASCLLKSRGICFDFAVRNTPMYAEPIGKRHVNYTVCYYLCCMHSLWLIFFARQTVKMLTQPVFPL